jgi:ABC-type multidrug transport system fused ATPase/permease subunit
LLPDKSHGKRHPLRQLYAFMSPRRRRQFHLVTLLMLVGAFAELVSIAAILPFLSLLADAELMRDIPLLPDFLYAVGAVTRNQQLVAATALFGATVLIAAAIRLLLAWAGQKFIFRLGHDIGVEIQRRVLSQPYSYHVSQNTSSVIASLEKVQVLVFNVLLQLMQGAIAAVLAIFIVAGLFAMDPFTAALSATAFGAMYALVTVATKGSLHRNSVLINGLYSQRVQLIQESLGGIRDIIIDDSQPVFLEAFRQADDRLARSKAITAFIAVAPRFVIEAAGMILLAALALIIADREGGLAGALPILGALALGAQRLLPLIQQVYYGWSAYAGNRAVAGDVLNLLGMPVPEHATVVAKRAAPLSFKREIRIEGVSFAYAGRSEPALSAVSLTIPRGARVALIGQTGSGKSTLADLLMGLLEPGSGQILVDGVPLVGEARRAWRQSIAHVPQAIFLADTSVERNIAFGVAPEQIDRDRVVDAARRAELHSFLAGLPDGYQTPVGERGVRFSGGQRQRLGIARAIYKAAPVLVLDEATSALDSATEEAVTQALADLGDRGMTIIMIAHRLSTIENCDIVVRLENGRVVATGSYQEVVRGNVGDLPGHG